MKYRVTTWQAKEEIWDLVFDTLKDDPKELEYSAANYGFFNLLN